MMTTQQLYVDGDKTALCPCCGQKMPVASKLVVDLDTNTVTYKGEVLYLSPKHMEVLYVLHKNFPKTIHSERIIALVWNNADVIAADKLVQVAISRIRRHLRSIGWGVRTRKAEGYQLVKL